MEEGSPFEINISSRMRRRLDKQIGDYDAWMASTLTKDDVFYIFDAAMEENVKYFEQSKTRLHGKLKDMETP